MKEYNERRNQLTKFVSIIDMNMIYLHTLLNISKHRPEQNDGLWLITALPSMQKLIITEYSESIVTEQMTLEELIHCAF